MGRFILFYVVSLINAFVLFFLIVDVMMGHVEDLQFPQDPFRFTTASHKNLFKSWFKKTRERQYGLVYVNVNVETSRDIIVKNIMKKGSYKLELVAGFARSLARLVCISKEIKHEKKFYCNRVENSRKALNLWVFYPETMPVLV